MNSFCEKVYETARRIPSGRVATYRTVAEAIGAPCAYRAVGNALSKNRDAHVPCHRVVRSDGDIGEYARGREKKKKLLKKEGVFVSKYDRVDARSIARFL